MELRRVFWLLNLKSIVLQRSNTEVIMTTRGPSLYAADALEPTMVRPASVDCAMILCTKRSNRAGSRFCNEDPSRSNSPGGVLLSC
eukprot:scaffold281_cov282-Ochromonas_danica.AAC.13